MADRGLILACRGCCCGHAERGGPKPAPGILRREMRRAFRRAALDGAVRLAFSDCLGPCSEANVVFLYLDGRPTWLRRVNDGETFTEVLDHVRTALDDERAPLSPALRARSFRWTGGGDGPEPPIADG
jgi:cobaltochelatase CobN